MKVDIPEDMKIFFYGGSVFIGLKENAFQPSSCLRRLVEFNAISPPEKPIECHYHDRGPEHNLRHMGNKLANIAYLLHRNLDLRSLLNIGFQGVG